MSEDPADSAAGADLELGAIEGERSATAGATTASALWSWFLPADVRAVAGREYRIVVRSRLTLGIALLVAVFAAGVVAFGASGAGAGRYDAVAASLVELGVYLVPLVGVAAGYDAIVAPAERGTLELLFSLPIGRRRVVLATYAGRAAATGAALVVGFLPGAVLSLWLVGPPSVGPYATVVVSALLVAAAFLAIGLLVSTLAREKTHALGAALVVWLWFVLLHDLAALAAISTFDLQGTGVAVMVVTNPADCFRVLALSGLDATAGGIGAVLTDAALSIPLVAAALLAWVAVPLALASWRAPARRL